MKPTKVIVNDDLAKTMAGLVAQETSCGCGDAAKLIDAERGTTEAPKMRRQTRSVIPSRAASGAKVNV